MPDTLKARLGRDKRVQVLPIDGYAGLKALLPPRERRGLVLIDPPFESPDEFETLLSETLRATRIWSTGTYMLWYPLKNEAAVARFARGLVASGLKRVLQLHLTVARSSGSCPPPELRVRRSAGSLPSAHPSLWRARASPSSIRLTR